MNAAPRLAYAQARVQARLADLPAEQEWERLASARTLSAYLEEARSTGFAGWVRAFSGLSQPHDLERGCLTIARESVRITADWAPAGWRPAIEWLVWLPTVSVLEHLARDLPLPEWVAANDPLRALVTTEGGLDRQAVAAAGLSDLLATGRPEQVGAAWAAAWRARWPHCGGRCRHQMAELVQVVHDHLDAFRRGSSAAAWGARRTLRARLRILLHLRPVQPVVLFAYLGILFIDLERLRGALLSRAVFERSGEP
jgi:hypothetical protein